MKRSSRYLQSAGSFALYSPARFAWVFRPRRYCVMPGCTFRALDNDDRCAQHIEKDIEAKDARRKLLRLIA